MVYLCIFPDHFDWVYTRMYSNVSISYNTTSSTAAMSTRSSLDCAAECMTSFPFGCVSAVRSHETGQFGADTFTTIWQKQ